MRQFEYSGTLTLCDGEDRNEPLKLHNSISFLIRYRIEYGAPVRWPTLGDPGEPAEPDEVTVDAVLITAGVPIPKLWADRPPLPDPQFVERAKAPDWLAQIILANFDDDFLIDYAG